MRIKKISKRRSIRLKAYDYSKPGFYYITICSRNLEILFGEIRRDVMYPSAGGQFIIECWNSIPKHYPQIKLHAFTLMPNHVHGILEIIELDAPNQIKSFGFFKPTVEGFGRAQDVEPLPNSQLLGFQERNNLKSGPKRRNKFQHIIPGSLGAIVRGFEIGVTKWFRQNTNVQDVWQRNFYDSIIRSQAGYLRVTMYINNNQKNWTRDRFYKKPK